MIISVKDLATRLNIRDSEYNTLMDDINKLQDRVHYLEVEISLLKLQHPH